MKDYDLELADEVYIFYDEKKPGIKFYDRSPNMAEQRLTGVLAKGVYLTDKHSIEKVNWDAKFNVPNGTLHLSYMDGAHNATTYVVSKEKYTEILDCIKKSIVAKEDRIKIDTREKPKSILNDKQGPRKNTENNDIDI